MDTATLLSAIFSGSAALIWAAQVWGVERQIRRSVGNTSRFPLFDARDRLYALIRSGTMQESDPVWGASYAAVTEMLRMERRLDAFRVLHDTILLRWSIIRDKDLKARYEQYLAAVEVAEQRAPEFKVVMQQVDRGAAMMISRRTRPGLFRVYVVTLRVAVRIALATLGSLRACLSEPGTPDVTVFRHYRSTDPRPETCSA